MEELLNKLIEKGWKPFWLLNEVESIVVFDGLSHKIEINYSDHWHYKYLRQIVSKESWLWQFVCENELTTLQIEYNNRKPPERWIRYHWNKHSNTMQEDERLSKERKRNENYEYRLIESSLKDESELEQFLLDNIKI